MPIAVSVVCTFLNAEDTIEFTLTSLRDQTSEDVEFILVDDGSIDRSLTIAESFAAGDPRFVVHKNPDHGRGKALNLAVAAARSEYVAILDADDLAHPAWLSDGIAAMRRYPDFAVISFERIYIRDNEQPGWTLPGVSAAPSARDVTRLLARANLLAHSGAIIRRAELIAAGGYDARRRSLLDYDLWIRLAEAHRLLGLSDAVRIAKRYHGGQKFAHTKGYSWATWKEQFRAIVVIDRNYRNFLRLGLRVVKESARSLLRGLTPGAKSGRR